VRAAFAQARSGAASLDAPLRLRLFVGPSAPELHNLRWETLRDPEDGAPLLLGEQLLFSRYLSSGDWRPVKLRPKGDLRALVAVANPSDLAKYKLAPVDVAGELERAKAGLGDIPVAVLGAAGTPGQVTLGNLAAQLRDGYDVLYLACHGALVRGEPRIWLEDEAGATAVISGAELVARLQELAERPRHHQPLALFGDRTEALIGEPEIKRRTANIPGDLGHGHRRAAGGGHGRIVALTREAGRRVGRVERGGRGRRAARAAGHRRRQAQNGEAHPLFGCVTHLASLADHETAQTARLVICRENFEQIAVAAGGGQGALVGDGVKSTHRIAPPKK
jgi:hypothetical protein